MQDYAQDVKYLCGSLVNRGHSPDYSIEMFEEIGNKVLSKEDAKVAGTCFITKIIRIIQTTIS